MKPYFFLLLFFVSFNLPSYSQGCSDAGFCSISGMNPSSHIDSSKSLNQQFMIGVTNGLAQFGVFISSPYIQYDAQLAEKVAVSTKLNYTLANGPLTTSSGLSDLFVSVNYSVTENISIINGVKAPFNNADKKYKGYELPMSYQTSLGTVDYLIGLSFRKKNVLISVGAQIPIIQNSNSFFVENYIVDGINENYTSTNNYIRKTDVIARFNYLPQLKNDKLKLTLGLLPIYHISNDEFTSLNNVQQEISGSKGITLNANSILRYELSETNYFDITAGIPLLSRQRRPDGLSQLAINFQYGVKF